jgi:phospholipid/cholesterol/gamma-HCH transport system ATP-binding protein
MNVYDNVALPLYENTHLPESEIRRRVSERLAMVGMVGMEHKMPSELSGGMRKRIGLARAIVTDPEIILYDEPTSGLDPVMSRTIDDLVRELQARLGVTSVVVTHDLHSAFAIGDRLIMLSNGKAVFSGTPKEFANSAVPQVREFVEAQFSGGNLISH